MTTRLVVLAYNEEAGIGENLAAIRDLGLPDLEVLVVDDGSTDRTESIVRQMKEQMPLDLLSHEVNRGVGAAFETGLRHAASVSRPSDFIITIEGDGTNSLQTLRPIIELLGQGYDVVCGSRYVPGGGYRGFPLKRRIFSVGANVVMRWYCGLEPVRDYTLFYRGYRAQVLQEAFERYGRAFIQGKGFFANIEILVKLSRLRPLRAAETPVVYDYGAKRSRSSMRVWKNLAEYLRFFVRDLRRPARPAPASRASAAAEEPPVRRDPAV
jgi:dolichol-phosphate mannosyltransferase